jgi:hypothetical protein
MEGPLDSFLNKLQKLERLRRISTAVQKPPRITVTTPGKPTTPVSKPTQETRVYAQAEAGSGFRLSLMGFDFADEDERKRVRKQFTEYLNRCGIDPGEADSVNHSWELASHRYSSPDPDHGSAYLQSGKAFLIYGPSWRAALDVTDPAAMKLFDHYKTVKEERTYESEKTFRYFEGGDDAKR